MVFYLTIALLVQAVLAALIFDKFNYFCAICFFVLSAWAAHYHMHWLWQASVILLGVLYQLSVYSVDIWEEVVNPFKYFTITTTFIALALVVFCFAFLYQLNAERVHIQNFFRLSSIYIVLLLIYIFISCMWSAVSIIDYLAPKTIRLTKFNIINIFSKKIQRAGTTNYLEAKIDGVTHNFVLTSVAYSVLKDKKEINLNLWQAFSGRLLVNNDFLRNERGPWRLRVSGNILFLILLIAAGYGLVYYLAVNTQ